MTFYRLGLVALTPVLVVSSLLYADSCTTNDCCGKVSSHTFFNVRPQFQNGSPEHVTLMRSLYKDLCDERTMACGITVFGGRSTKAHDIGQFFSPFCNATIAVDGTIQEQGNALLPQHFNIFSVRYSNPVAAQLPNGTTNITESFTSTLCLEPKQTVVGLGLAYAAKWRLCNYDWLFAVSAPLEYVRNDMHLTETNVRAGEFYTVTSLNSQASNLDDPQKTMRDALNQKGWSFGKIACDEQTKTRLAFIQAMVGVAWLAAEKAHATSSVGVTIPTGNRPKAAYVFEPIVGTGGHAGIYFDHVVGAHVWDNDRSRLTLETHIVLHYLFARHQMRSMDLKNMPWSRYIELYADKQQATTAQGLQASSINSFFLATPGINVLTQEVNVKPGFNATANMACVYAPKKSGISAELGYNFYARQAECVELACPSTINGTAIKDHSGRGIVNPLRTMTNNLLANEASVANITLHAKNDAAILADYTTRALTASDIDLNSAAHPSVLSHTVYSSFGYHWSERACPLAALVGASYELSGRMNSSLDRWLVWGSVGIEF